MNYNSQYWHVPSNNYKLTKHVFVTIRMFECRDPLTHLKTEQVRLPKCYLPWFHASAVMLIRSALFWDTTQRRVVILYWPFEATHRSYLQGSVSPRLLGLLNPWRWDRYDIYIYIYIRIYRSRTSVLAVKNVWWLMTPSPSVGQVRSDLPSRVPN
jgi:hypothetical protein